MTSLVIPDKKQVRARQWAEQAAVERLLNAYLRETGWDHEKSGAVPNRGAHQLRVPLPNTKQTLCGVLAYRSATGHHRYAPGFWVEQGDGSLRELRDAMEVADTLIQELAAGDDDPVRGFQRGQSLRGNILNSIEKTTLYLTHREPELEPELEPERHERLGQPDGRERSLWSLTGAERFAAAEQTLLCGHPFHPTPKSSEGFSQEDLHAYAPELGAAFRLQYFAAAPHLVQEAFLPKSDGDLIPPAVQKAAQAQLSAEQSNYRLLPCHPWQAQYLKGIAEVRDLIAAGLLLDLGALGNLVYPTSSVRTVWDPQHKYFFKLPLNVRITHFVRVNPLEQLERTIDASRVLSQTAPQVPFANFRILREEGYRTLWVENAAPAVREELAASFGVIWRENPARQPVGEAPPLVVATLLEQHPWAEVPPLLEAVRTAAEAGGATLNADFLKKWLRQYLAISLQPLLWLFTRCGVSMEAHVQNSMVTLEQGWPTQFWVRDLEGVSIVRARAEELGIVPESPVLLEEAEAWQRLQYYFFVNHLGHLIHTLGDHGGVEERELWQVVAEQLEAGHPTTADLLQKAGLPAKANLTSAFQKRGETPSYVQIPNPLLKREV
jgi:siderophore synthetase component